jgi:hypothetical protein
MDLILERKMMMMISVLNFFDIVSLFFRNAYRSSVKTPRRCHLEGESFEWREYILILETNLITSGGI